MRGVSVDLSKGTLGVWFGGGGEFFFFYIILYSNDLYQYLSTDLLIYSTLNIGNGVARVAFNSSCKIGGIFTQLPKEAIPIYRLSFLWRFSIRLSCK